VFLEMLSQNESIALREASSGIKELYSAAVNK
jgi:hypothetical protein